MSQSASDLIMGSGGSPSAKFPTIGTVVKGEIVDTAVTQQRDFATGDLKYWKNGDPMMQAVVTLQTDERDAEIDDDDGQRRLFVSSKSMREAIRDAVRTANASHLKVGGKLAVQYTGDGQPERGMNPPKLYAAKYEAPINGINLSDPF